jgi:hypothetical protein
MGGAADDTDYNNGSLQIACTGPAHVLLIQQRRRRLVTSEPACTVTRPAPFGSLAHPAYCHGELRRLLALD